MVPISETNNELRNDEINKKRRERYVKDVKLQDRVKKDNIKYRERHPDVITTQTERRFRNDTCKILTQHSDNHKDDDERLTTDFIADQLKKFKDKIYDKDDLKLLKQYFRK